MTRTRLSERTLPAYSHGEELFHMISHIVGGAMGVLVLTVSLWLSLSKGDGWAIASSIIYGLSFIQLYTISSVYHGLRPGMAKKVLQVLDHCTIYFFIAGTYTPVVLCALRPQSPGTAWALFGTVWGLAALATVFTAIDLKKYAAFSMVCYIGMGWCVVFVIKPVIAAVPAAGLWLIAAGGVAYTLGAVLYGLGKKKRYMHALFHLMCLVGSGLQAIGILGYVL